MRTPPDVLLQWQTAFPHRRFYLFADSSVPEGTLPAQIERCTMEGWLTDSVASAKLLGWSVRPLPFHCTTLAMSCPAPRLAASVLGLLYSNRGGSTASRRAQQDDHCELRGWQWRGSKLSRHPLVKKTFLTSGFFPALADVTPDRSRRGRCCPRPGGCPAPGRCGGFPPCGRARGSRRPAFPRALRRRSAG